MSIICKAIGMPARGQPLGPLTITRRQPAEDDVVIEILYAGICHSDIHTIREEWGPVQYPLVTGHEIVGIAKEVGPGCKKFKVGDTVGVGCLVDSCRQCKCCHTGNEQFCIPGGVSTYNSAFKYPHCPEYALNDSTMKTQGGYSQVIVVNENFVLRIPESLKSKLAATAPLLCAGITTYSPLKHFGLKSGQRLAVCGLGGLGHMGVKIGKAFGAHVTVISRGLSKKETALAMGADEYIDVTNSEEMKKAACTFDFMYNTIAAEFDIESYLSLLDLDGTMICVGAPPAKLSLGISSLIFKRRRIVGSLIGGIPETQEMLDFCAEHNVVCDIEMIDASQVNEAYDRAVKGDVKYRFVIDAKTI